MQANLLGRITGKEEKAVDEKDYKTKEMLE